MRLTIGLVLGLLALTLVPGAASAQSRLEATPTFSVSQVYDDNLFATRSAPVADYIWRLSPRLGLGRHSARVTIQGEYGFDAEIFREHPELSSAAASHQGFLAIRWKPSPGLAATATGSYANTHTAGALNTLTGLQIGRADAHRLATSESLSHRLGALTEAKLEHSFALERIEGLPDVTTQTVVVGLERRREGRGRARLRYAASQYVGVATTMSHAVTLGWTAGLTRFAHFEFDAGPRRTGRKVSPDVSVGLGRRFRKGGADLSYVYSTTTVVGFPAPVTADGVAATLRRQIGPVSVAAVPAYFRVRSQRSEAKLPRVGLNVAWHLTRDVALAVSHQYTLQRGGLAPEDGPGTEIARNTFTVGLVAVPITR